MVSFHILQSYDPGEDILRRTHADAFTKMAVLNELSSLNLVTLRFHHDHPELATSMNINTKLTYLELIFYGTEEKISIYSLIPVLRVCTALRQLNVIIKGTKPEDNHITNTSNLLSMNEHESSTISPLKILDLQIWIQFDIRSLNSILRCVPSLEEFCVTVLNDNMNAPFMDLLINGHNWQRLLTSYMPNMKKFDFLMTFLIGDKSLDSTAILHSFNYFQRQYDSWHMAVSRWQILQEFASFFTHSNQNDSHEYVTNLSSLIDLSTVSTLEFKHTNNLTRSYVVPHVLLACVNVTELFMHTSLFFSSGFIDNSELLLAFDRITQLHLSSNHAYLSPKHGSKIVERFPSLTHIEMNVYSLDCSIPLVEIFVGGLKMLKHLAMRFSHEGLIDDAISRDHIIEKRRQLFGLNRNDEYKVIVKIEEHNTLYIWIL
ncbi:unnamed protein product [Adineta ricciae]|uniref:Uncharacterized protein n=1 Tax=Adineta ricciae TaxID=249248 RepID=A0A815CFI6_ADIRI|nr:unnamed protein product [Adineta ricciae]